MYTVSVNSVGVSARGDFSGGKGRPKGGKRGECHGMSAASRRRLVRFLGGFSVPDREMWSFSLTVRHCDNAFEWRERWRWFGRECARNDLPFVWRVELQKRGVPHVHLIHWGDCDSSALIRLLWLRCWGVEGDPDHEQYAVNYRKMESDGWALYVIYHQIKDDSEQAGWHGRHWGVVRKDLFEPLPSRRWELTNEQYGRFRNLYYWFARRRGRVRLTRWAGFDDLASDQGYLVRRIIEHVTVRRPDAGRVRISYK